MPYENQQEVQVLSRAKITVGLRVDRFFMQPMNTLSMLFGLRESCLISQLRLREDMNRLILQRLEIDRSGYPLASRRNHETLKSV